MEDVDTVDLDGVYGEGYGNGYSDGYAIGLEDGKALGRSENKRLREALEYIAGPCMEPAPTNKRRRRTGVCDCEACIATRALFEEVSDD